MRKAAKVYEAGESVEGNKPKVVYESHKKCTPGEFGAQVKSALAKMAYTPTQVIPHYTDTQLLMAPLLGAGIGGIGGALLSDKKTRLRNALLGAAGGGLVGGGAALGYKLTNNPSARMLGHQKDLEASLEPNIKKIDASAAELESMRAMRAAAGGSAEELADYAKHRDAMTQDAQMLRAEPGKLYQNLGHRRGQITGIGAGLAAVPFGMAIAGSGDEADARKKKKEKTAFEKAAIPAFGGRNYSLAPHGSGIGLNAGYDYLGGVIPNPYVGIDIGTPHTGLALSGPIPGIGFRSGMFSRPPGATSNHNRTSAFGHRSLWKYLADSYSGRSKKDVEDEVHDDRLQSMRNVTKDEFHEAIPDYHEGPKGKPLSKDLHKALTEYYHANSRPEKQSAIVGGTLGALGGLLTSDPGQRNEAVGRGAVIGAGTELGMYPGAALGGVLGAGLGGLAGGVPGAVVGGGLGLGLGGVGGATLGNMGAHGLVGEYKKTDKKEKEDDMKEEKQSAHEFGQKVAFNIDWNMLKNPTIGGAALGAVAGGVHGLINPGEDERGNQRSRFGAMLRGALGGGALGTAGGAAIGHFAPNLPRDIYNFGRRTLTGKTQGQLNMGDNVAAMTPQQQALHARAMQPFKPKSITEQFPEEIQFPQQ